jgi:hypothetical protein
VGLGFSKCTRGSVDFCFGGPVAWAQSQELGTRASRGASPGWLWVSTSIVVGSLVYIAAYISMAHGIIYSYI